MAAALLSWASLPVSLAGAAGGDATRAGSGFARIEIVPGDVARLRSAPPTHEPSRRRESTAAADAIVLARCVATRVARRHLLTAAHCLPDDAEGLRILCPGRGTDAATTAIERVVRHPSHDAALLVATTLPPCLGAPLTPIRALAADARFATLALGDVPAIATDDGEVARRLTLTFAGLARGRALTDAGAYPTNDDATARSRTVRFVELGRDAHVLRFDDRHACLARGDSGYPVFADGALAAMLIGGTEGCPSLQTGLRLDRLAPWLDAVLGEARNALTSEGEDEDATDPEGSDADSGAGTTADVCAERGCLVVAEALRYCSIDPERLPPGGPFATKATLTLPAGHHAPRPDGSVPLPPVVLETSAGMHVLAAAGPAETRVLDTTDAGDGTPPARRLQLVARYAGRDGTAFELVLVAAALEADTNDARGRSGTSRYGFTADEDAAAFLARGALVSLRDLGGTSAFPGAGDVPIAFAPCELAVPPERFDFELADGTRVAVTLAAAVGAHELGFYIGRPQVATVTTPDGRREVTGHDNLAFVGGSRQIGELALPTLAVRTGPFDGACGLLLDASAWDSPAATNGYVARRLDCDGRVGAALALRRSRYPERYVLP